MEKRIRSVRPLFYLVLINLLGMALIMLEEKKLDRNTVMLCAILCVLSIIVYIIIGLAELGDGYLFVIISMLSSIGVIMQMRIDETNGMRQMKLYLVGVLCFFAAVLVYRAFHKYWSRLTLVYFSVSATLFALTALFGKVRFGSKNWIVIGGISVQPSEFIRILYVMSLAAVFTGCAKSASGETSPDDEKRGRRIRLIAASAIAYINSGFLLLQREWGISVLFFIIFFSFLYIYGNSRLFLVLNALAAAAAGFVGVKYMSHIQVRVATWLDPFADVNGKGYQLAQSLFAIGTGGFSGSGIGNGSPYLIPVVSSDFIFSAICEEMGVLGGIAVLMLYFVLVYRGFKIALSCTNAFNKAVSMGLSVMLGVQTFIIVGGVIRLIPLTGITLPFISYGGSSMVTTFAALGILQAISGMKGEVTDEIE